MKQCAAIRRPDSDEPCMYFALPGCTLCLSHIRSRHVVLWRTVNESKQWAAVKCQAAIRGWMVRLRLHLAGPGVLRRKGLANQEDLETCEEVSRVHPLQYFAFEESGKIWWFDFQTIWKWSSRNLEPSNPYTKVPLTSDTRARLRSIWRHKRLYERDIPAESGTVPLDDRFRFRLNIVCQLLADYKFGAISPDVFSRLSRSQWSAMFKLVQDDLPILLHSAALRTRELTDVYLGYMRDTAAEMPTPQYIQEASRMLFLMLMDPKNPYVVAFAVLSALYRV